MEKNNIYLDYSATTKPEKQILDKFNYIALNYWANPNSNHSLGLEVKKIVDKSIKNICDYFGPFNNELIFTSGASEANNLAIKGLVDNSTRKHIITTQLEHSSVLGPIGYLQKQGFRVDFVPLNEDGLVDLEELKKLLSDDTLLVSIGAVDSEIGIRQRVEEIGLLLLDYPDIYFHSDITQILGKDDIDITNIDLVSFSGHKIYGFKGIGGLIKKQNIKLTPIIHGGKSTTVFRSGTPAPELICSLSECFNLFKNTLEEKKEYVANLNKMLCSELGKFDNVFINSNEYSLPHILNISIVGKKADDIREYFAKNNIFISTKTACASNSDLSRAILTLTKDENRASSSVRISLSYKTKENELKRFIEVLKEYVGVK